MFIKRRAFSLVELLITLTIFSIVAVLCVKLLVNSMASAQRIQSQVYLYSEANALMDQLAAKIQRSAVDYEAYYLRYGYDSPESGWDTAAYGLYGQSFYHPGPVDGSPLTGPYSGIEGYKALCSDGLGYYPDDCPTQTPKYIDLDLNTGAHPFTGIDDFSGYTDNADYMNAFCEATGSTPDCNAWSETVMQELILLNGPGDERTVYRPVTFGSTAGQYNISMMQLTGTDSDYDGIVDDWVCTDDYSCSGGVPVEADFESITPSALNISSFYIYIAPFEDPYRAFAEEAVQIQPQVTIVMTVTLSDEYSSRIGSVPSITVQRTISTGVYGEIPSYE